MARASLQKFDVMMAKISPPEETFGIPSVWFLDLQWITWSICNEPNLNSPQMFYVRNVFEKGGVHTHTHTHAQNKQTNQKTTTDKNDTYKNKR